MATGLSYKELFEVKILHHFFLDKVALHFEGLNQQEKRQILSKYNIHSAINIHPTDRTSGLLRGLQLIMKPTSSGFTILSRMSDGSDDQAFSDLQSPTKLTFCIQQKNPMLLNFSALPLIPGETSIYHFSNLNKPAYLHPCLSQRAPVFDGAAATEAAADGDPNTFAYFPGDLLTDSESAPTAIYEATRSTNNDIITAADWRVDSPAEPYDNATSYSEGAMVAFEDGGVQGLYQSINDTTGNNPSDTSNWTKLRNLPLHYVTVADKLSVFPRLFNYTLSAADITATFEVNDADNNTLLTEEFTSHEQQLTHQVDMRRLPEGKYSIAITNNADASVLLEAEFYLVDSLGSSANAFGIIDIYLGSDKGDYSVVDASNLITRRSFELRIKNRSTIWRYFNKDNEVVHESAFNPLTKYGFLNIPFNGNNLPNPDELVIKPEPTQYYSDIFLNTST